MQESQLGRCVRWTLLSGVALSGAMLVLGLLIVFLNHQPRPEGPPPTLPVLMRTAVSGNGLSILSLGLLVLMVTPLLRVSVLAAGWFVTGQRRFALVALIVLSLLALSIVLGVG